MFTDNVKRAMDNHIPSKLSSSSHKSPWITREVRRMSKKKQRLYNKAKKSQTEQDWRAYKPGGGWHSHMEVTGMCGHDPQSRGLLVTD